MTILYRSPKRRPPKRRPKGQTGRLRTSAALATALAAGGVGVFTGAIATVPAHAQTKAPPPKGGHVTEPGAQPMGREEALLGQTSDHGSVRESGTKETGFALTPTRLLAERIDLNIAFPANSARLSLSARQHLDKVAGVMRSPELRGIVFGIYGHTDASGAEAYNLKLSRARAMAVAEYLVSQGVPPQRLEARGFGEQLLKNASWPYSAENRRVEVVALNSPTKNAVPQNAVYPSNINPALNTIGTGSGQGKVPAVKPKTKGPQTDPN